MMLPVAGYNYDGQEIRQSDEMGYAPGIVETELADEETKRAGIPHLGHEHVLMTYRDLDDRVRNIACGRPVVDDHVDDAGFGRRIGAGVVVRDLLQCRLIVGRPMRRPRA